MLVCATMYTDVVGGDSPRHPSPQTGGSTFIMSRGKAPMSGSCGRVVQIRGRRASYTNCTPWGPGALAHHQPKRGRIDTALPIRGQRPVLYFHLEEPNGRPFGPVV